MRDRQKGIALVLVLWLTVLLTAIAAGFAYSMHTEAIAAGNAVGVARVRAAADGAIERTVYELAKPRVPGAWLPNGGTHAWKDGEIDLTVRATDETAKIDLNGANEILLRGLFTQIGGVDPDTAGRLVDAVIDWRDPDDFRRPNGAEPGWLGISINRRLAVFGMDGYLPSRIAIGRWRGPSDAFDHSFPWRDRPPQVRRRRVRAQSFCARNECRCGGCLGNGDGHT